MIMSSLRSIEARIAAIESLLRDIQQPHVHDEPSMEPSCSPISPERGDGSGASSVTTSPRGTDTAASGVDVNTTIQADVIQRLKRAVLDLAECMKPNDNADGEWSISMFNTPDATILGPKYATRASRMVVATVKVDSLPGESSRSKRIAEALVLLRNAAPALLDAAEENSMLRDDLASVQERLDAAKDELRCPDCGCADPIDAESAECGCDSPICARTVDDGTLAESWLKTQARLAEAEARAERYRLALERIAKYDGRGQMYDTITVAMQDIARAALADAAEDGWKKG